MHGGVDQTGRGGPAHGTGHRGAEAGDGTGGEGPGEQQGRDRRHGVGDPAQSPPALGLLPRAGRLVRVLGTFSARLPRGRAQAQEDPCRDAQYGRGGHGTRQDVEHRERAARRLLGDRLAERRAERRQSGEAQRAGDDHHGDAAQRAGASVQDVFVDAAVPVQEDARAGEQRGLHPGVSDDVQRDAAVALGREGAETDQEQAGVGDRRVREEPLDVPLVPAHHRAGHCRRRAQHRQDPLRVGGGQAAGAGEDGVVDAPDAEDAQLDHDAGQQHAHRGGGDRVCVRQPELEGHRRRLDQKPGQDEDEPGQHQRVGRPVGVERVADACQGEFAGTGVEQGDAHQQRVGAQRVDHGEGERALHGPGLLDAVSGQGVGDDAHQLEPDEGVEQVAGDREAAHARLEDQHERREGPGVAVRRLVEGAPGVGEGGEGEHADERGHAEAGAVAGQEDADAVSCHGLPAARPFGQRRRGVRQREEGERRAAGRDRAGGAVRDGTGQVPARGGEQGGAEQRYGDEEGQQVVHQPRSSLSSSGSTVPCRLATCTTRASRRAVTVAPTTTSVRARAWTTGSTTGREPGVTSEKTGAVPPSR